MSKHIIKEHNKTVLVYHLVCPIKYRRKVLDEKTSRELVRICNQIAERYEVLFLEIGVDKNHVHFLIQSVPTLSITRLVTVIKSITARKIFEKYPEKKKELWGANFWTSGFYANTVGQYGNEAMIKNYVKNQGRKDYKQLELYNGTLFDSA